MNPSGHMRLGFFCNIRLLIFFFFGAVYVVALSMLYRAIAAART
jgi:hypothetical protein